MAKLRRQAREVFRDMVNTHFKTTKARFACGDWVRFVGGLDKDRTTTITDIRVVDGKCVYFGFFCGKVVCGTEEQTEAY